MTLRLVERATGRIVADRLAVADTWLGRTRGLMFRESLPAGEALLLVPCASIHTHWMRFAIDVAMLDGEGTVTELHEQVVPWRFLQPRKKTHAILEFAAKKAGVAPGDRLRIESVGNAVNAKNPSLSFLRDDRADNIALA